MKIDPIYIVDYRIDNQKVTEEEWNAAFDRMDPAVILTKNYIPVYHRMNLEPRPEFWDDEVKLNPDPSGIKME